ncbi:MAG: dockerin type I domain-containing protein [Patescibacteria group bacterium]
MKNERGSTVIIITLVIVILVGVGIAGFFLKSSPQTPSTQKQGGGLSETKLKGDINRDEKIDAEDADLVRKASPCNHAFECWNKVVGKTKDGDNPIYTSDLDLNHDDNVNELDISAMSSE